MTDKISSGVITNATFLKPLMDAPLHRDEHVKILQCPANYPYAQKLGNLRTKKLLKTTALSTQRTDYKVTITKQGKEYFKQLENEVQVYGNYELFPPTLKRKEREEFKPVRPDYSPQLLEALMEVEVVGADNEKARQVLIHCLSIMQDYLILHYEQKDNLHGTLKMVQDATDKMRKYIMEESKKIEAMI